VTSPTIGKELLIQLGSAYDCTTTNIEERNSLEKKDGTIVYVIDATGDDRVSSGGATFRWNDAIDDWILLQKDSIDAIIFDNFEGVIENGKVEIEHIPTNGQLWDILIINQEGTIVDIPKIEDLTVDGSVVSGLSAWNNNIIRFSYAYGSQEGDIDKERREEIDNFNLITTNAILSINLSRFQMFLEIQELKKVTDG
jgi:hypothetical protein